MISASPVSRSGFWPDSTAAPTTDRLQQRSIGNPIRERDVTAAAFLLPAAAACHPEQLQQRSHGEIKVTRLGARQRLRAPTAGVADPQTCPGRQQLLLLLSMAKKKKKG